MARRLFERLTLIPTIALQGEIMMPDKDSNHEATPHPTERTPVGPRSSHIMAMTGYLLLTGCVGLLGFLAYMAHKAKAVEGMGTVRLRHSLT